MTTCRALAHDLCRDWDRWTAAERLVAVATILTAVATPAIVLVAAPPI
jgi:hypothetical protein